MGLSAGQARLLTITSRKSDCEYESMRLSHQKIALSRDMNIVSAEYQDAINQTNLVYDFYGNNSQVNPLSYNLLMSPSALNDYIPTTITDKGGRVVLNSALANAAKAAGIPQEGLDGLPSSDMRNAFVEGLIANGVISANQGANIKKTTYNQLAGVGSEDLVNVNTSECSYTDLIEMLGSVQFDISDIVSKHSFPGNQDSNFDLYETDANGNSHISNKPLDKITMADLLSGNYSIRGRADHQGDDDREFKSWEILVDLVGSSTFWDSMFEGVEGFLDTGDKYTQAALEYARSKIMESVELLGQRDDSGGGNVDYSNFAYHQQMSGHMFGGNNSTKSVLKKVNQNTDKYIGIVYIENSARENEGGYDDGYGLNMSSMAQAYLTYFAQYMEGISDSDYHVEKLKDQSNLVDDMFTFTYVTDVDTSGDNLLVAGFYDAMFNQICLNGWTENDKINDNEYLEEMLKSGAMYMSTLADDGFYYQGNYSTNTYVKEVTDEKAVAQAEAKYNREKQKINSKETVLDMKMKNLDTEISALTTEYDTVKSVINKNIEKTFKRYSA